MDGETYRWAVAAVTGVGFAAGATYLLLYRPSRWRSATARDSSGWVLALTLFFLWSLWRVLYVLHSDTPAPPIRPLYAWTSLALGVLLVGVVLYRLLRFIRVLRHERTHPTVVCSCCQGSGVVPVVQQGSPAASV